MSNLTLILVFAGVGALISVTLGFLQSLLAKWKAGRVK